MPEIRQLRYFIAVAEESSFTRAAQRLHIAQQSLSGQIRAMERQLGVQLFERDSRGTTLSAAGTIFLPEARAVLARADRAIATLNRAMDGDLGRLNLGFLSTVANHVLPPVVRTIREQLPKVQLVTETTQIAALVEGVRNRRFDVAFTRPPLVADLRSLCVASEPVCAVFHEHHRLADRTTVTLAELADESWVLTPRASWQPWHEAYDAEFERAGFTPAIVATDSSVQTLLGLVAAGVGITRLARSAQNLRRTGVVFVPIEGSCTRTEMIWMASNINPVLPRVIPIVRELAASVDLTVAG